MQGLLDYIITRDTELEEWTYDPKSRRYRNKRTGRYMSHNAIVRSRDRYIEHRSGVIDTLVSEVLDSAADVPVGSPAWHSMISQLDRIGWWEVESTFITAYVYGKGGINNMGAADYTRLNTMLSNQRRYWDGFMADIGSGQVTIEVKISTRMNMYTSNARSFHARGMASAWDMDLPTYPGEQDCGPNCRCSWKIRETKEGVEAYWVLGSRVNNCDGCLENADMYNPYVIEREEDRDE